MDFKHVSVLLYEAVDALDVKPDGIYIDGTAGGGGHSSEILKRLTGGRLFAIDRDPDAISNLREKFSDYPQVNICQGNYSEMGDMISAYGVTGADGILLDIGVSSYQLDTAERGFSYHTDAPLDMRMSKKGTTAADLVNTLPENEIARILNVYGEEKYAALIAKAIAEEREEKPILTTLRLAEIVKEAVPARVRRSEKHPARKTFQALRIAVNEELDELSRGLDSAFSLLKPGGSLAVITFHSLEDRLTKQKMNDWCKGCTCPPDFPVCVCGKKPKAELIYKKGLTPSQKEQKMNYRARSARLRACRKL